MNSAARVAADHPTEAAELNFGIRGASCGGFFAVSPEQKWLAALARFNDGSQALLVASLANGIGPFTRVADVPLEQTVAKIFFSPHDDYLALTNVELAGSQLSLDIPIVALADPPAKQATFHVTTSTYLNFVQWAPSGSRYFVHTTRIDASGRGSNPIFVGDAETGLSQEVTAPYFFSSSRGFTSDGEGILTDAYDDASASHPVEWIRISSLTFPLSNGSRIALRDSAGSPVNKGFLRDDGSAFFGITGFASYTSPNTPSPFHLLRFDFNPEFSSPPQSVRLSEYAEVRRWLVSPRQNDFVYRVAVTSGVYSSADPITQSHFTSEAGTYLLPLEGGAPVELAMEWNSFQTLEWLPDASGLLRLGPANPPSVEWDWTVDDGQFALVDPTLPPSIFWLRLDGGKGVLTDLTPYLGEGVRLATLIVYMPELWLQSD